MWKHREVNESTDKLLSIAGIAAISLAIGWSNETKVDNLGQPGRTPSFAPGGAWDPGGRQGRGGEEFSSHECTSLQEQFYSTLLAHHCMAPIPESLH